MVTAIPLPPLLLGRVYSSAHKWKKHTGGKLLMMENRGLSHQFVYGVQEEKSGKLTLPPSTAPPEAQPRADRYLDKHTQRLAFARHGGLRP